MAGLTTFSVAPKGNTNVSDLQEQTMTIKDNDI